MEDRVRFHPHRTVHIHGRRIRHPDAALQQVAADALVEDLIDLGQLRLGVDPEQLV
jgi:hypothetical protein